LTLLQLSVVSKPNTLDAPALSFVIPLYRSAETIAAVVHEIEGLQVPGGHELILVNDDSPDNTAEICRELLAKARIPITYVEHARNFGEHNAVLTGWRHARGAYVVNLDDDGQQPPPECVRLYQYAAANQLDAAYGHYAEKKHSFYRNAGSWFTNRIADHALDKPRGFYLSSFRCVSALAAKEAARHAGPYPYIDGLLLQATQRIGALQVEHRERAAGQSGYTFRRLVRLWLSSWINFSVLPLRLATLLGIVTGLLGLASLSVVAYMRLTNVGPFFGWGTLMATLLIFSGTQLLILGILGEYLGRMFLTLNQRPQSVIRSVTRSSE
jgi:glycosyltransferase involved in cell wall biosynthesis